MKQALHFNRESGNPIMATRLTEDRVVRYGHTHVREHVEASAGEIEVANVETGQVIGWYAEADFHRLYRTPDANETEVSHVD